jgi:large subunit ribosomal protein L13
VITNTFSLKPKDVKKQWLLIDANNMIVGRMAAEIAKMLRGKDEPIFTPHVDSGKNIIVINAEKVRFTGNKIDPKNGKSYFYHTGFPGGIKEVMAGKLLAGPHAERVIKLAVKRMLPKSKLARHQFANLYVYKGENHPHAGQAPVLHDLANKNAKNTHSRLGQQNQNKSFENLNNSGN